MSSPIKITPRPPVPSESTSSSKTGSTSTPISTSRPNSRVTIPTPRLILRAALATDAPALHAIFSDGDVMRYWSTRPHSTLAQTEVSLGEVLEGELNGVGEFVVCLRSSSDLLALANPVDRGSESRGAVYPEHGGFGDGGPGEGSPSDGTPSEVIGKIGIWRLDASSSSPSAGGGDVGEIGFMLHRAHWRRGLMREAMQALLPYLFRPVDEGGLGLEAVTADVDPRNSASLGLLGELGFEVTGREERTIWIDGGPDGDSDGGEWVDSVYLRLGREVWTSRESKGGGQIKK